MINCRYCGSKIWESSTNCLHCEEVLKPDFKLYLGGGAEVVFLHINMFKKFYLIIEKLSSFPITGAEIQLSGPPHVEIIIKSRKIHAKRRINKISFSILPKELGLFTLTAILTSEVGHRIVFPIKIRVEPVDFTYYYEERLKKPALVHLSPLGYYRLAILIIGLIGIMIVLGSYRSG